MKLDGEIWFRGGGAMKGDDSLGRDGIDARLNRARSPIPGWSRENLFGKRYRCEQSSAVEKRCESRHKFYPVDSRRKRNKKTIFFFKGWISLFFKQIYIPRKDRNCMRILCIKKKSYKAGLCIINTKNIRNECLNVERALKCSLRIWRMGSFRMLKNAC